MQVPKRWPISSCEKQAGRRLREGREDNNAQGRGGMEASDLVVDVRERVAVKSTSPSKVVI